MNPVINNILNNIPKTVTNELFQTLFSNHSIKIERIISQGQCSPIENWYDQAQDEWIIVLEGQAELIFEHDSPIISLKSGDYLLILAHTKHRVHWTHPEIKTIWLAIHIFPTESDHE